MRILIRCARPFFVVLTAVLIASAGGLFGLFSPKPALAAAMTNEIWELSANTPATLADHTIRGITPTGAQIGTPDTIVLDFPATWTMGTFALLNCDLSATAAGAGCGAAFTDLALATTAADSTWGVAQAGQTITFTVPTATAGAIAATACIKIEWGANAAFGGAGATQATNPTKVNPVGTGDPYNLSISGLFGDTGTAATSIIETTAASVTVPETLSFSIAGRTPGAGVCDGDTGTVTTFSTTVTTVPFGTIADFDAFSVGCQLLTVTTNAANGVNVTIQENTNLRNAALSTPNIADTLCDTGACSDASGAAWQDSTKNGLGYTCENITGTPCAAAGDSFTEYRQIACVGSDAQCDPGAGLDGVQNVLSTAGAVTGAQGEVHIKLSVNQSQAFGAYSNTITYKAIATF